MQTFSDIHTVVFDADDTLWSCQPLYTEAERRFAGLMMQYADRDATAAMLFETEKSNMPLLGFGARAFTLSLLETAVKVSQGRLTAQQTQQIIELGKTLMCAPVSPLPHVEETLSALHDAGLRAVLFTKGELLDQERKLAHSGLADRFALVEIVSTKDRRTTDALCRRLNEPVERLLFVGNSFPSDIDPPLQLGARAAYVPYRDTWQYETAEPYSHERLATLADIALIPALLGI